ncbi:hypothetical protein D1AOALGA4SA_8332 [Olavius algarvensis Delta 1 endosymbiont]|nr:hypothetical protein D1AOALGA4SA_8332 [Olavius algarvensis Delta 1 endosymbiont]
MRNPTTADIETKVSSFFSDQTGRRRPEAALLGNYTYSKPLR